MIIAATKNLPSILLIDDDELLLNGLCETLSSYLEESEVEIRKWAPTASDVSPKEIFDTLVDERTVLVVTDYDLTRKGKTGLFGPSIVDWCQALAIPVGDFSRANITALPSQPNLFELRVPTDSDEAAVFIASMFYGFSQIRDDILDSPSLLSSRRSLAAVLASLLGRPNLESQFALYMSLLGSANSNLIDRLRTATAHQAPDVREKASLLSYVIGHLLLNAILKYPGPILSEKALCAYLSTTPETIDEISPLFIKAEYRGPFSYDTDYFWRGDVDEVLDKFAQTLSGEQFETFGELNRRSAELGLGHELPKHECDRCQGKNGGFLCPFTYRSVCQRSDCSVTASSWIPQGAQLCRVEKDFYDEWAPLLGF